MQSVKWNGWIIGLAWQLAIERSIALCYTLRRNRTIEAIRRGSESEGTDDSAMGVMGSLNDEGDEKTE